MLLVTFTEGGQSRLGILDRAHDEVVDLSRVAPGLRPDMLNGSAISTVTGWTKLLNCEASTMYATITPSSNTNHSEANDSWNDCDPPTKRNL